MTLKYHAIINHEEIDTSNSIRSLKESMESFIKVSPWETIYIVQGKINPKIIREYVPYDEKWRVCSYRYYDYFKEQIVWIK